MPDEIGLIARTLNGLLAKVRSFNDDLKTGGGSSDQDLK